MTKDSAVPVFGTEQVRRARYAVAAVFAVHGAVTGSFATRVPWIQDHASVSAGQLGLALAFPAIGASLAMPLAGRVSHRFGARTALRGLLALWTLALILLALAPNLLALCAALFAFGASAGMSDVAMNALGVEVENRLDKSIMSGLHGMWSVGALIGSAGGTVAAHIGADARLHHTLAALVLTGLGLAACQGVLDLRSQPDEEPPPRFTLPPKSALVIGAVGFCAVFAEGASMDWSAVYLRDVMGSSAGLAAASTTAFALMMAIARIAGDRVVDRFGAVRTVRVGGVLATAAWAPRGDGAGRGPGTLRLRHARPRRGGRRTAGLRGGLPQREQPEPGHRGRRHHHLHLRTHRPVRDRLAGGGDLAAHLVRPGHGAGVRAGPGSRMCCGRATARSPRAVSRNRRRPGARRAADRRPDRRRRSSRFHLRRGRA